MDDIRPMDTETPRVESRREGPERSRQKGEEVSFQRVLQSSLDEVNILQNQAEDAIRELASGETQDLHRTMVMIEKADLSFRLMMKVRTKLLQAYQEIMRMPV